MSTKEAIRSLNEMMAVNINEGIEYGVLAPTSDTKNVGFSLPISYILETIYIALAVPGNRLEARVQWPEKP